MKLPEPIGVITGKLGDHCSFKGNIMRKGDVVYSESQVKELSAERDAVLRMALEAMTARGADWVVKEREAIKAIQELLK